MRAAETSFVRWKCQRNRFKLRVRFYEDLPVKPVLIMNATMPHGGLSVHWLQRMVIHPRFKVGASTAFELARSDPLLSVPGNVCPHPVQHARTALSLPRLPTRPISMSVTRG